MRSIKAYKHYYKDFFDSLTKSVQEKILFGLLKLKNEKFISSKYVKAIRDGIFELRIEYQHNIYRIFFIFDDGNIVILFNGFQKKSQKTPNKEIEKAIKLKKEYYEEKQKGAI
jgi:putative addiction module killer protein